MIYPENIGVGRPNHPQEAEEYYFISKCLEALGKIKEAKQAWKKGAAGREGLKEKITMAIYAKKRFSDQFFGILRAVVASEIIMEIV